LNNGICVIVLKNAYTINEQKKFDDKLFSIIDSMIGNEIDKDEISKQFRYKNTKNRIESYKNEIDKDE